MVASMGHYILEANYFTISHAIKGWGTNYYR
jgi:hypothetical protein